MGETFCGKICGECILKERLACPGCKNDPGKTWMEGCELALCCKDKGHEICETCSYRKNCSLLRDRDRLPEIRLNRQTEEAERKKNTVRKAVFAAKWIRYLFWLSIFNTIFNLMCNEDIVNWLPFLLIPGRILSFLASVSYGMILLKLMSAENEYRAAGICTIAAGVISAVINGMFKESQSVGWPLLLSIGLLVIAMAGEYYEFKGHENIMAEIDSILSESWKRLWKWFLGMNLTMLGSICIVFISPFLGLIAMLTGSIGSFIVSIQRAVYLYKTGDALKQYH